MKVIKVKRVVVEHVTTDESDHNEYRRCGGWEREFGWSWETVCFDSEIESAYQEYIASQGEQDG